MIKGFLNYFKAPPILPVTEPKEVIDKQYKKYHLEEVLSLHRIFESNNIVDSVKLALVLLFSPILSKKRYDYECS